MTSRSGSERSVNGRSNFSRNRWWLVALSLLTPQTSASVAAYCSSRSRNWHASVLQPGRVVLGIEVQDGPAAALLGQAVDLAGLVREHHFRRHDRRPGASRAPRQSWSEISRGLDHEKPAGSHRDARRRLGSHVREASRAAEDEGLAVERVAQATASRRRGPTRRAGRARRGHRPDPSAPGRRAARDDPGRRRARAGRPPRRTGAPSRCSSAGCCRSARFEIA